MKKIVTSLLALTLVFALVLTGCGKKESSNSGNNSSSDDKTITVGASSTPHAEILEQVKDTLADEGYTLKVVVYDDYVLPNTALNDGTLDANYFQHTPYLESFNASNNTKLAAVAKIHYEPFGIYGNGITDLKDLKDGATIIIPADDSNETRALFLLAQENLIKLADGSTVEKGVTTLDIVDDGGYNITAVQADTVAAQLKNLQLYEVEAAQLPRVIGDVDVAVINGNYALAAGLKIADALASEDASGEAAQTYANIVAVRKADVDSAKTKALVAALTTQKVKDYINNTYNGAVVPIF